MLHHLYCLAVWSYNILTRCLCSLSLFSPRHPKVWTSCNENSTYRLDAQLDRTRYGAICTDNTSLALDDLCTVSAVPGGSKQ